jgi:hypothetical protein
MQTPQQQSINSALLPSANAIITGTTLNATPTGSTDTAVLRWDTIVVPATDPQVSFTTTAAAGTIVTLTESGVYLVDLTLALTGAVAIAAGIGQDMAAAPIVADPAVGTDGVFQANDFLAVAANTAGIRFATALYVDESESPSTIRFLATNSAGAAPVGLVAATASFRIVKVANIAF